VIARTRLAFPRRLIVVTAAVFAAPAVSFAASDTGTHPPAVDCGEISDPAPTHDPLSVRIRHAELFSVEYFPQYKILTVRLTPRDPKPLRYLLVQSGAPPPDVPDVAATITVPVQSTVALSNAYLPFISANGAIGSVVAVNQHSHVGDPVLREAIARGEVLEVGREGNLDRERLAVLKPGLVLTYGDGRPPESLMPLLRLGLPVVVTSEYREASPLAYAEWVMFFAAFYNSEATAAAHFERLSQRYETLRRLAANATPRPAVLAGGSYRGNWYVPAPRSYTARMIADAGAHYVFADLKTDGQDHETTIAISLEEALAYGRAADIWIDTMDWRSLAEARGQDPRYALFRAFEQRQLYNNDNRRNAHGTNTFWETGLAEPDTVLADLVAIFHPELRTRQELKWYRRLPETRP
jgi:iron complex transport system substrate-binding protein